MGEQRLGIVDTVMGEVGKTWDQPPPAGPSMKDWAELEKTLSLSTQT